MLCCLICASKAQALFPKEKNGLWGYVDKYGKWRINPDYHYAGEFHDDRACVMKYFDHNRSIVKLYGYIDINGKLVIPMKYNYASDFNKGIAIVGNLPGAHWEPEFKYGSASTMSNLIEIAFVNKNGEESNIKDKIHYADFIKSDSIRLFYCLFVPNSQYGKKSFITKEYYSAIVLRDEINKSFTKKVNFSMSFKKCSSFVSLVEESIGNINELDTHLFEWSKGTNQIIYKINRKQLEIISEPISDTQFNKTKLKKKSIYGMWGLVNEHGKWVVPAKYDWIYDCEGNSGNPNLYNFYNNYLVHCATGWGVINSYGKEIVPPIYEEITNMFSSDVHEYLLAIKNNKTEVLYKNGKRIAILPTIINSNDGIINFLFERKYNRILFKVSDRQWYMTDTLGNFIQSAFKFGDINDKAVEYKDAVGNSGFMDLKGKNLLSPQFAFLSFEKYFVISYSDVVGERYRKQGVVSYKGETILKGVYDNIIGIGKTICAVKDDTYMLYTLKGEQIKLPNGSPVIMKDYYSHKEIGDKLLIIETNKGYLLLSETGNLISNHIYNSIEMDESARFIIAIRKDSVGRGLVDKFDLKGNRL